MPGEQTHGVRPAIAADEICNGLPALQRAQVDAGGLSGGLQARTGGVRGVDVSGLRLAIFEADHSPSPLLKIAATFFDRTSEAAISANAFSLCCWAPSFDPLCAKPTDPHRQGVSSGCPRAASSKRGQSILSKGVIDPRANTPMS